MHKLTFILLLLSSSLSYADQLIVEAFYDKNTRLINVHLAERISFVTTYDLSAPDRFNQKLSEGLSSDPSIAQKQAKERILAQGNEIQSQLISAYEGSLKAMQYEITKLPAVVFNNGQQVIYGENDVNKAIKIYYEKVGK
ncbi:TIGR03757 family integrating conjugative element protein [Methylophaga thalassica]|jgi:integrating conjugative element protein (TIGR03757 family)|uniref:TIGR03757 family integrating conjugative element protein n=1 Tax=Methylophaga thalassica TaxID=40223 RepID=UPI002E7BE356|nr:TIGR03757 family integrating conjugative element protein [Methylophaga thalassica]WVI83907.1 TIGR03757 family integrating conjugative element protein [Methylophaga thalassica]